MFERLKPITRKFKSLPVLPTEHDIKSVEKLAERLRGATDAETLVNILEWLERNLTYWTERACLGLIAKIILAVGLTLLAFLVFCMLVPLYIFLFVVFGLSLYLPLIFLSSFVTCLILVVLFVKITPSMKLLVVALGSLIYGLIMRTLELRHIEWFIPSYFLNLSVTYLIMAGGAIFIFSYLFINYLPLTRYFEGMPKLRAALHLIDLTFMQELPITYILRLRRGVCRDYAKLTSSILINLFPSYKIYMVFIPRHVATSIEINDKMYVLDQKLPVMLLEIWLNKWKRDRPSKILILLREGGKIIAKSVNKQVHRSVTAAFDLDRELVKLVEGIFDAIMTKKLTFLYTLADYAKLFDEDEIMCASLIRKVKIILEKELISRVSLIRDISLAKHNDDLVINIAFSY